MLYVIAAFLALVLGASFLARKTKLPYTLVLVFLGIVFTTFSALGLLGTGTVATLFRSVTDQVNAAYQSLVNSGIFVGLVVPPLIFAAMIHIRADDLRAVLRPAGVLATGGVVVATMVVGLLLWFLTGLPLVVSFLIGAILAPTDVVTVLEVFQRIRAPSELAAMLDLEAALNDATAIVVFTVVLASVTFSGFPILRLLVQFAGNLGGGVLVGLAFGFAAEALASQLEDRVLVTIITVTVVYGAYTVSALFGVSGLVAVAVAGLYFGNLTLAAWPGPSARNSVVTFWEIAAFLGTSVAFLFIGFQVNLHALVDSIPLIALAYLTTLASRAVTVFPVVTWFKGLNRESYTWSGVTFLGGMRGALSMALVSSVVVSVAVTGDDVQTITSVVFGVVFLSLAVQIPVLYRFVRARFPTEQKVNTDEINRVIGEAVDGILKAQLALKGGSLTEEEFVAQVEEKLTTLNDSVELLSSTIETRKLVRARAAQLYRSVVKRRLWGQPKG